MKRLLLLVPLLLTTMGIGPCDSQPLGDVRDGAAVLPAGDGGVRPVDGARDQGGAVCRHEGTSYAPGETFLQDSMCDYCCGTCTCQADGSLSCVTPTCVPPGRDGGVAVDAGGSCFYNGQRYADGQRFLHDSSCTFCCGDCFCSKGSVSCSIPTCLPTGDAGVGCPYNGLQYSVGSRFPAADGCNTCSCGAGGSVSCTEIACRGCFYNGYQYAIGATFKDADGCNDCSCSANGGVACTLRACVRDGGASADGPRRVCTPGLDQTCNDDPTLSSLVGACLMDGTCLCRSGGMNPMTGKCLSPRVDAGAGCSYQGSFWAVGESYRLADGCNTCLCIETGQSVCTKVACPGTKPTCEVDAVYTYGSLGGFVAYQDQATLVPPSTYVLNRTSFSNMTSLRCAPALPMCQDPMLLDISDIMADIAHPDVQRLLAVEQKPPLLLGYDSRPIDGSVFSFQRGDGRSFLVGSPCRADATCTPIPAGVQKLVDDLRALDRQQVSDPSCAVVVGR